MWLALAIAAQNDYNFITLDVTSAFLYADLPDNLTLLAQIPAGHPQHSLRETHCLQIKKNIYGLKEGPLLWWQYLKRNLLDLGLQQSIHEPCLFHRPGFLLLVYVDDMLLLGNTDMIKKVSRSLSKKI